MYGRILFLVFAVEAALCTVRILFFYSGARKNLCTGQLLRLRAAYVYGQLKKIQFKGLNPAVMQQHQKDYF